MDKIASAVSSGRRAHRIITAQHERKIANWAKVVRLSVLKFVWRFRNSDSAESAPPHHSLYSAAPKEKQYDHPIRDHRRDFNRGHLSCARMQRVDASTTWSTSE